MPSENARDNLAARYIAGLADGAEVDLDVHGEGADKFTGHVQGVQAQLQTVADDYVRSQGIDPEAFYRFVRFQGPAAVRSVALTMYHSKGDAAYTLTPLIQQFRRTSTGRG
jgi:hypothetical protein